MDRTHPSLRRVKYEDGKIGKTGLSESDAVMGHQGRRDVVEEKGADSIGARALFTKSSLRSRIYDCNLFHLLVFLTYFILALKCGSIYDGRGSKVT